MGGSFPDEQKRIFQASRWDMQEKEHGEGGEVFKELTMLQYS